MKTLEHRNGNCTGTWYQDTVASDYYWKCNRCHSMAYMSHETTQVVAREKEMETLLHILSLQGEHLRA